LGSPERIAAAVNGEATLSISAVQVEGFCRFARANQLFFPREAADTKELVGRRRAVRAARFRHLLKPYLFVRIPVVRPNRFLETTLPIFRWIFTPAFFSLVLLATALGMVLICRQWSQFLHGYSYLFSAEGLLVAAATVLAAKLLHELAHGYAAVRFGCRVPVMGVGPLVFWPIFWTDTTDAWKLSDRRQRIAIDAAGIVAELAVAAFASVAWAIAPDGLLRSSFQLVAGTTWLVTLGINLNPMLRFDGYFILQDLLEVANLQQRAAAMGRWWLREWLFNFGDPPPEALAPRRRSWIIGYAGAAWCYRFFLFPAISLLVYVLFFKLLGLMLLISNVITFIVLPALVEMKVWFVRRKEWRWSYRLPAVCLLLAGLAALLLVPWKHTVTAPALLTSSRETTIFSPRPARIVSAPEDKSVRAAVGDTLFELQSPDLAYEIRKLELRRREIRTELEAAALDKRRLGAWPVLLEELKTAPTWSIWMTTARSSIGPPSSLPSGIRSTNTAHRQKRPPGCGPASESGSDGSQTPEPFHRQTCILTLSPQRHYSS